MELKTINVTRQYGMKTAVDHINLTLTSGVYGLLGANGAGKTTLMRLICGLQVPTSGRILFNGKDIAKLGELIGICLAICLRISGIILILPHSNFCCILRR